MKQKLEKKTKKNVRNKDGEQGVNFYPKNKKGILKNPKLISVLVPLVSKTIGVNLPMVINVQVMTLLITNQNKKQIKKYLQRMRVLQRGNLYITNFYMVNTT